MNREQFLALVADKHVLTEKYFSVAIPYVDCDGIDPDTPLQAETPQGRVIVEWLGWTQPEPQISLRAIGFFGTEVVQVSAGRVVFPTLMRLREYDHISIPGHVQRGVAAILAIDPELRVRVTPRFEHDVLYAIRDGHTKVCRDSSSSEVRWIGC